ncbi:MULTISPECIES: HlyD family secretion protein [unclassified Mesorhizobium]|uniref:HlyD family secretion protein n=1 Tax=unclassified Mesorhizobium TaxID=325217 RepID=UPI0003CDD19C|nr:MULTISPECIES: HlyD family secretion protein [unclassified Mesorhizobium]ESY07269.1 multidrug transporter [Mesorhizobium sp. LNJC399B00]ESY51379.1 multidrug transporter [Mesorhizobium sp. LNJC374B00]WJI70560.1 HlyD family secretion protein [Mesorhizobium sp. C399B]WJI81950.1 HlyD family secretion protein [Mesorhizobium sp. C374B]WJI88469.1 HlyD family secretion protein [Mesorhizobium sp. C372A]
MVVATVTISLSGAWAWQWYFHGRFEETTDNAYLRGDITSIAPKLSGYVVEVPVGDNANVRKGSLLFRIDDSDYRAKLDQAIATLSTRQADIANIGATQNLQDALIEQAAAQERSVSADLLFARANLDRYTALQKSGTASEQKLQDAQTGFTKAEAADKAAAANTLAQRLKLGVLSAQLAGAQAAMAQAKASVSLARMDLANTLIQSPIDGVVGNRQVRVGRYVTPGTPGMDIVPVQDVWVVANFKETQLNRMEIGQSVRVMIDEYPGVQIDGVVDSFAPGSGAAFSVLPPDNATGNFIRVVQRVPVKIRLTHNPLPGRLLPGLSARIAVRVSRETDPATTSSNPVGELAGNRPGAAK